MLIIKGHGISIRHNQVTLGIRTQIPENLLKRQQISEIPKAFMNCKRGRKLKTPPIFKGLDSNETQCMPN